MVDYSLDCSSGNYVVCWSVYRVDELSYVELVIPWTVDILEVLRRTTSLHLPEAEDENDLAQKPTFMLMSSLNHLLLLYY